MVAAIGSLLHARAVIERRRWRAAATAKLIPAFALHNLSLDPLRVDLRDASGIVCPEPWQPVLAALLERELAREVPRVRVVSQLVEARWHADHVGCAWAAMSAALYAEDHTTVFELPAMLPDRRLAQRLRAFAVSGAIARHAQYGAWGEFHGNLEEPGSEAAFPASPSLVLALVETAIRDRADRTAAIERIANNLGELDRRRSVAHLARVLLVLDGPRAAERRLRALRDDSVRDAGQYLVAREAVRQGDEANASRFAAQIRGELLAQRARIAIARLVARRGEPLRARRLLGTVRPELAFEHWRVRTLISLHLRSGPQPAVFPGRLPRADVLPTWFGEPIVDPYLRDQLLLGTSALRLSEEDDRDRFATTHLGRCARDPVVRREAIETLDELGHDAFSTIGRLREHAEPDRLQPYDVLFAELIAARAEAIVQTRAELPRWVKAGIAGDRPPTTQATLRHREALRVARQADDAATVAELLGLTRQPECPPAVERRTALEEQRSLDRALYDEGSVWGATPRRLGIVTAARACLRGAVEQADWDPALVECRARTLGFLGGTLAREALESVVAQAGDSGYLPRLVEALCWIDREAARRAVIVRACAPRDTADPRLRELLSLVELYRGLPRGFARTWCETARVLGTRLGERRARTFLAEVVELHGNPDPSLLAWIAVRAVGDLPDARSVLGAANESCEALSRVWPVEAARRLADDAVLRETMLLVRGVRAVTRERRWTAAQWASVLARAASPATGVIERGVVRRCARLLRCDEARLFAGDLVGLGAHREHEIDNGAYRVRLLQKRADILQYLRFADVPVANCYHSDSYGESDVIAVWKDPLSLCVWIERADGRPHGFAFGNFVELATGDLALAVNGMYLARQRLEVRTAVLRAIERMVCVPLGIRHLGVGNQFAGRGPFPIDYRWGRVSGTRLRALRIAGALVTDTSDDISHHVNVPEVLGLHWKVL